MVSCLSVTAVIGSLFCSSVWLAALIQFLQSDLSNCHSFFEPYAARGYEPSGQQTQQQPDLYYASTHILPLPVFIALSLTFSAVFFLLFYFQLFQHDRLAHEVLLEDLAESAASSPAQSGCCGSCTSFTHALLLVFNGVTTLLLAVLCVLGVGSINSAVRPDQADSCRQNVQLGFLPLFLDFFACLQYFVLTGWRCVTRWIGEDTDVVSGGDGSGAGQAAREAKAKKAEAKGKRGKPNGNVKYSAVDAEDDELFDADALEGDEEGGGGAAAGMRTLHALSGSDSFNLPAEEEVEMMDMLEGPASAKKKPPTAGAGAIGGGRGAEEKKTSSSSSASSSGKVPALVPPPKVEAVEAKQEKKEEKVGEGDEDEAEYDYGDVEEEEEEHEVDPM